MIYKSVIIAKLLYASSACFQCMVGVYNSYTDCQRLEALDKRGICSGLCVTDVSTLAEFG